jgi:F-box-like
VLTIDVLPDDVLLEIFDHCVVYPSGYLIHASSLQETRKIREWWQSLVHVCRRWRGLVFGSPRRLNLQLRCKTRTPARETLDVWPALPLYIRGDVDETSVDNVIAELELSDRMCQIELCCFTNPQIESLYTAMEVPFPELIRLFLSFRDLSHAPVLPDSFLGGSTPHLRYLAFNFIPFPGLPKLLLASIHLVGLYLHDIPHSGYFSPEAMVTCLSMLTSLDDVEIKFESPRSFPDQENRRSLPPTRSVLPALMQFGFKGVNEYLEEFVARIDTPRLRRLNATFFNDIEFHTPELIRFVSRSSTLKAPNKALVFFDTQTTLATLLPQAPNVGHFTVEISCRGLDWQLSSLAQICTTSLPLLSTTENLFIYEQGDSLFDWKDGIENIEWLELLLPFTAVKNLYLSKQFALRIAPVLQEMTVGGTTEVLSTLQNLYLEGFRPSESVQEGIERFVSARQLANRPVAISVWERPKCRRDL